MRSTIVRGLSAALLLAAPLSAQPRMAPMADCPMMTAMMHGPAAALRERAALRLSPAQATELQSLQAPLDQMQARAMDSMPALHRQIAALVDAPRFDDGAVRAALERMERMHSEMGIAMLRAQHETARILTAEQRDLLRTRHQTRMGQGPGMPMDGMMCMPMMGRRAEDMAPHPRH